MLEAATYRAILAFCNPKSSDSLHNTPNYPKTLQRNIKKEALEKKTVIKKLLKDFFLPHLCFTSIVFGCNPILNLPELKNTVRFAR